VTAADIADSQAGLSPREETRLLRQIAPECAVFAIALIACGLRHVLWWYPWEDQAAHQYMAWGIFHGMRPYVDAIDMNWPGIVLVHVVAYLLAGTASWGLRGIDLLFQFGLLAGTAYLLAAWRVPRPMRLLAGCSYLMTYLATGWWWTAQRESFNWPLWVIGTVPFLVALGPSDCIKPVWGRRAWFILGSVAGLSLWIKPTPVLALFVVVVLALLLSERQERAVLWRGLILFTVGMIAVSIAFIIALAAMGSLAGFLKWSIYYAATVYGKATWPWSSRLIMTCRTALSPAYRPVALVLAVIGFIVALTTKPMRRRMRGSWRRPCVAATLLMLTAAATAILQGKTNCVYHFLPMRWSFSLLAGVVWAMVEWNNPMRWGAYLASIAILLITFASLKPMGPTPGTAAVSTIGPMLRPDDQVIMWGASTTLLAGLEHRTPFPFVGSTAVYLCTPPGSKYRRELLDQLDTALSNRSVKLLLVEQGDGYAMQNKPEKPREILQGDPPTMEIIRAQYRELPASTVGGFDVWEHVMARGQHR
jgi:hypothetical protein